MNRPIIASIVSQHVENGASLRAGRSFLVRAPHITLRQLSRHDERLEANLDGTVIAGAAGLELCREALDRPTAGEVFVAAYCAIRLSDNDFLEWLLALAEKSPEALRGLTSTLGWLDQTQLRGLVAAWMGRAEPMPRSIGIAACAMHGVDPGAALAVAIESPQGGLAGRALRSAGELGRVDLRPVCIARLGDSDARVSFEAARAAVLLGDRSAALGVLLEYAHSAGPFQREAVALAMLASQVEVGRELVRRLSADGSPNRLMVQAAGLSGDPAVIPWLIKLLSDETLTRVAGEAVSCITGVDLAELLLDRPPPLELPGPNDDPAHDDVALHQDDSLPWPDPDRLNEWWRTTRHRFSPGVRSFAGSDPTRVNLLGALALRTQRQRAAAAALLALARPQSALFNVTAPAWRQQRWLAKMQ